MSKDNKLPVDGIPGYAGRADEGALPGVPKKKGFPVFGIPALLMLALMLAVFGLEIHYSTHQVNALSPEAGASVGLQYYEYLLNNLSFLDAAASTLMFRGLQIAVSAPLACVFCALFYAMKKPRTVLTSACLWLIPACLPYLTMSIATFRMTARTDTSGIQQYLFTSVLQTASIFCFFGGLFTFLNLKKKGRHGGGPWYGLLIALLIWLLSGMTANAVHTSMVSGQIKGKTLEYISVMTLISKKQVNQLAAGDVLKVLAQIVLALVPVIVLCILARRKSTKGKTPLATLLVLAAVPAGVILLMLRNGALAGLEAEADAAVNTVIAVLIGGGFGGLIAYSFIHLLRRVPCVLFGLIAAALAATMSCTAAQYLTISRMGLDDTVWPQVFFAAFDGRLVLIITGLAFALRDYTEIRPGSLALAVALLTGALLWGEINVSYIYNSRLTNVALLAMQSIRATSAAGAGEDAQAALAAARTTRRLLLAVPPLLMGAGAALLLKRSFDGPGRTVWE